MPKCAIKSCRNNSLTKKKNDGVTYHSFPMRAMRREAWRMLVARERSEEFYKPKKSSVICSSHFHESDLYTTKKGYTRLKQAAIPYIKFDDVIKEENSLDPLKSLNEHVTNVIKEKKSLDPLKPSDEHFDIVIKEEEFLDSSKPADKHFDITIKEEELFDATKPSDEHINNVIKKESFDASKLSDEHMFNAVVIKREQPSPPTTVDCNVVNILPLPSTSGVNPPMTYFFKEELKKYHKKLELKNRHIRNLRKQNERLKMKNLSLTHIIQNLRKKPLIKKM